MIPHLESTRRTRRPVRRLVPAVSSMVVATTAAAGLAMVPSTAHAAGVYTSVTSPRCNTILADARRLPGNDAFTVSTDHNEYIKIDSGKSTSITVPAGVYYYLTSSIKDGAYSGRLVVAPCSATSPKRTVPGDENGDGRSDVFGISAAGDLLLYTTRPDGTLNNPSIVGHGWGSTDWIGRINEINTNSGMQNLLITHRTDNTMWFYQDLGGGKLGSGRQIGSGVAGTNFAITPSNWMPYMPERDIFRNDGGKEQLSYIDTDDPNHPIITVGAMGSATSVRTVVLQRFDDNANADKLVVDAAGTLTQVEQAPALDGPVTKRVIGHGWGAMQILTAPGDLDANGFSDLIARRSDGNLYLYRNTGGRFATAQQIGVRWGGVKLLA